MLSPSFMFLFHYLFMTWIFILWVIINFSFCALIILTKISADSFMLFPEFLQQAPSFLLAFLAYPDVQKSYFPHPSSVINCFPRESQLFLLENVIYVTKCCHFVVLVMTRFVLSCFAGYLKN